MGDWISDDVGCALDRFDLGPKHAGPAIGAARSLCFPKEGFQIVIFLGNTRK